MSQLLCAITGARGYLGQHLVVALRKNGLRIRELNRTYEKLSKSCMPFHLGQKVDKNSLSDVDILVHCAYDYSEVLWQDIYEVNVVGTMLLLEAAKEAKIKRVIYISSISAFEGCQSLYGRAKLECELMVKEYNGITVRPGLIFGHRGGIFIQNMENMVKKFPILPYISGSSGLYLCHVDDLSNLIVEIINKTVLSTNITITAIEPTLWTFKDMLGIIQKRNNSSQPLLPVPWRLPWILIKIMNYFGISTSFRSDGLIGFIYQNKSIDISPLKNFKTFFRKY
jgi:nucleoside-diphosphate-sugar epimerase